MKAWSIIGLLFAAAILATVPVSPQVTPRGNLELTIDKAEAYTYGRARASPGARTGGLSLCPAVLSTRRPGSINRADKKPGCRRPRFF